MPAAISAAAISAAAFGTVWASSAMAATTLTSGAVGPQATVTVNCGGGNAAPAINNAINQVSGGGGGTVHFPSGTCHVNSSVHLKSNVTFQLDSGAVLTGNGSGYDAPESNPNDRFQDFGHSHFHDAMFWGDKVSNVSFVGSGRIDGGGKFITGNPKSGQADKLLSITRCSNLTLSGITLARGGHFAALINGCDGVKSDHLTISTASDRDGWNIINTSNATITNITDAANDDALVFKSDFALGQRFTNQGNVTVDTAHLSAKCCNALMFGSETCSNFTHYNFNNITITRAGKSGLGMVSMDGAVISDVHYRNVTMSGTQSPIMIKIGTRKRCGDHPGVGDIHDVTYDNVRGTSAGAFSPTIWGQPGHLVTKVTFTNVHLSLPGGHGAMSTGVPSDSGDYNPRSIGTRPAYGWYLHEVSNITFNASTVDFGKNDGRPAFLANAGNNITLDHFTAEHGSGSPFDIGFQNITGFCVRSPALSNGGTPNVNSSGSSKSC